MRPWRLVSSLSPMRPSSRAEPLTTFSLDVALYGTVALCATTSRGAELAGSRSGRAGSPPFRNRIRRWGRCPPAPDGGRERSGLDRAAGVGRTIVVDHRARDRQQVVAGLEDLDDASLTRPLADRARRHLPESCPVLASIEARPDDVGVDVAVEPENNVAHPVHDFEQLIGVDVSRPTRASP